MLTRPRASAIALLLTAALTASCQNPISAKGSGPSAPHTHPQVPRSVAATSSAATPVGPRSTPAKAGQLSDAQLVGQLFMTYVYGASATQATPAQRAANIALYGEPTAAEVVHRWHLGGVILIDHNNLDPDRPDLSTGNVQGPAQIAGLTAGLQRAAKADSGLPLLIATDQEGGRVQRITNGVTPRPAQQALAGLGAAALTCSYASLGRQLRSLGVNQDFAPDADVVTTSTGVIGDRSFGPNPALDATDVAAAVRGLQDAGVLATLKHWPGHGSTSSDSHTQSAVIHRSVAAWRTLDRVPFAAAAPTAAGIMVGHLAFPAVDPSGQPATLSGVLTERLLRQGVGYAGLIITDSLWMAPARAAGPPGQVALRALNAGNDILLEPANLPAAYLAVLQATVTDPAMRERVLRAVERISAAKARVQAAPVPRSAC